jgi:hypothetical protein
VELDFGSSVFNGDARWLEITAITNGGGAYVALSPFQRITAAPYAIKAASAMAVNMGTISNPSFIGTTTTAPLELFVNNLRGLRIEDNGDGSSDGNTTDSDGAPNIIGGSPANSVAAGVVGVTISGGGALDWGGNGARPNTVAGDYATIGGGYYNTIKSGTFGALIGGGTFNSISQASHRGVIWG